MRSTSTSGNVCRAVLLISHVAILSDLLSLLQIGIRLAASPASDVQASPWSIDLSRTNNFLDTNINTPCHAAEELARGGGARMLSTGAFLKEAGSAGGFRREVPAFAARWVYGRGTPRLSAGFVYNR